MFRPNNLREKLHRGKRCLGGWLIFSNPDITEIMAHAGFDALVVDHEHTPASMYSLVDCVRAAGSAEATIILRLPDHDPTYLGRCLDAGVEAVMFPGINSAAEMAALIDACRYPPEGMRGVSVPTIRAAGYGLQFQEYLDRYWDELLIIAQIETVRGADAIEEICALERLDMIFIGLGDLSADMGLLGKFSEPRFTEVVTRVEDAARRYGKLLGGVAFSKATTAAMFERNYHFIASASDLTFIREGATSAVKEHSEKYPFLKD